MSLLSKLQISKRFFIPVELSRKSEARKKNKKSYKRLERHKTKQYDVEE